MLFVRAVQIDYATGDLEENLLKRFISHVTSAALLHL
jgi:hypothetical protein